ncbi:MAG: HEAT repeat domain-containing protein [Pseudobdellovibrionaceae bacterium]
MTLSPMARAAVSDLDHPWSVGFSEKYSLQQRWSALQQASEQDPKQAKNYLQRALTHPQWFMRNAGLVAMAKLDKQSAIDAAQILIKDKALVVRSAAVDQLSPQIQKGYFRQIFWSELHQSYNFNKGQSLWIRYKILQSLSAKPLAAEKPSFQKFVNDKDVQIQTLAHLALKNLASSSRF